MERVRDAMKQIDRADFLPSSQRDYASVDAPIPIGHGQTNSQPSTVRRMLEWLDPQPGNTALDVGSGSGWTTALLSVLVGENGFVRAVELVPELVATGRQNCAKYHLSNVSFHQAGERLGKPEYAPYDRILVSAGASTLPQSLLDQLAADGRMVIPVGHVILEIHKTNDTDFDTVEHRGFIFVPLLGS